MCDAHDRDIVYTRSINFLAQGFEAVMSFWKTSPL
jgi:hypothetical protein